MICSPYRLLALGLSPAEAAAWLGLTPEEFDQRALAEQSRRPGSPEPPRGKMMTRLLRRPDLEQWESRQAER